MFVWSCDVNAWLDRAEVHWEVRSDKKAMGDFEGGVLEAEVQNMSQGGSDLLFM